MLEDAREIRLAFRFLEIIDRQTDRQTDSSLYFSTFKIIKALQLVGSCKIIKTNKN